MPICYVCMLSRSIRWLDRCIKAHKKPDKQNLFGIVQGGLDPALRTVCANGRTGSTLKHLPQLLWYLVVLYTLYLTEVSSLVRG